MLLLAAWQGAGPLPAPAWAAACVLMTDATKVISAVPGQGKLSTTPWAAAMPSMAATVMVWLDEVCMLQRPDARGLQSQLCQCQADAAA